MIISTSARSSLLLLFIVHTIIPMEESEEKKKSEKKVILSNGREAELEKVSLVLQALRRISPEAKDKILQAAYAYKNQKKIKVEHGDFSADDKALLSQYKVLDLHKLQIYPQIFTIIQSLLVVGQDGAIKINADHSLKDPKGQAGLKDEKGRPIILRRRSFKIPENSIPDKSKLSNVYEKSAHFIIHRLDNEHGCEFFFPVPNLDLNRSELQVRSMPSCNHAVMPSPPGKKNLDHFVRIGGSAIQFYDLQEEPIGLYHFPKDITTRDEQINYGLRAMGLTPDDSE